MNKSSRWGFASLSMPVRLSAWLLLITASLLATACGGDSHHNSQPGMYAAGSKSIEDVDRELKFDARVQTYEAQGDKLVVDVNQSFASSPPGIQQRALSHWYSLWQAARTPANGKPQKSLEVIARYEGSDLAKWNGEEGFKSAQVEKAKSEM
jgi:hypothetical protein